MGHFLMTKQEDRDTQVNIERASARDVPRLVELLGVLFSIEQDFVPDAERQAAGLRLLLEREGGAIFVARDARCVIVGMATAQLVVSTAEGALSAWIEDVVVDAALRRGGVGRALIAALLEWAEAAGATRAQLLVDTSNAAAEGFYGKLGWQTTQLAARRMTLRKKRAPGGAL